MHPDTLHALALVGQTVTYGHGMQGKVQSVTGPDFLGVDNDGATEILFLGESIGSTTTALVIPTGRRMGEGYGQEWDVRDLRRGVSLAKGTDRR